MIIDQVTDMKKWIKRYLFRRRGINIDSHSDLNYSIQLSDGFIGASIRKSHVHICSMGDGCLIDNCTAYGNVDLGNYVSLSGPGILLHSISEGISIGNFVSIAPGTKIFDFNHNMKRPSTYAIYFNLVDGKIEHDVISKGKVVIEDDVWIGANCVICSGVHIGRGAVIGAGSVVTKNCMAYTVYGGASAEVIKRRFDENQIAGIERYKWWQWDRKEIKEHIDFLSSDF